MVVGAVYAPRALAVSRSMDAWPSFTVRFHLGLLLRALTSPTAATPLKTRPPHRPNFIPGIKHTIFPTLASSGVTSIAFTFSYYLFRLRVWRSVLYVFPFLRFAQLYAMK